MSYAEEREAERQAQYFAWLQGIERRERREERRRVAWLSFTAALVIGAFACGTGPDWWKFALCSLVWAGLGLAQWRAAR